MRASADHRVRSKLVRLWCGDAARVEQVNAVPAKRCGCVVRLDAGRFPASFFPLPCCSCGEMRLPRRMSAKVGAVCSGCEPNVSRETFGVAGCERIPVQGIRVLCMRQSMRPAARGTEGATPNNRAAMNAEAAEPCATIDVLQCALGVAPSDDKRKRTRGRGIPGPFFSRRQPDEESYRLSVKQREEELPAGESLATFAVFTGWRGDLLSASLLPISFRRKLE